MAKPNWEQFRFWYEWLQEPRIRGFKAELQHCKSIGNVYMQYAYVKLIKDVGSNMGDNAFLPVIANVLAHTQKPRDYDHNIQYPVLAKCMAQDKSKQNRPIISPLRFKQLLACEDETKLLRLLIRIIKQVEFFNIADFSESLYYWGLNNGVRTKKRWARCYYENLSEEFLNKGA